MKRTLCSALIAGLFASLAHAGPLDNAPSVPAANAQAQALRQAGVDVASFDPAVLPQDDFFRYSQGKWLKDVEIPADRSSGGAYNIAQENAENQIRTLIEAASQAKGAKAGSDGQKMGDYYASYMDEARRNALGLSPLKGELARVAALKDKKGIAALSARTRSLRSSTRLRASPGSAARS